jgi:mono/diheme cytochrome c family protein
MNTAVMDGGSMVRTCMATRMLQVTVLTVGVGLVSSAASAQDAALIKKGQQVYAAQKCQTCHSIAGKGKTTNPLDGVGAKLSAEDIKQWIVDPKAMAAKAKSTKKPPMPAKYTTLPAADLDALVAYMHSLK